MNADNTRLAEPFPPPPFSVSSLLNELRLGAAADPTDGPEQRRLAGLPRPWDPASCASELRREIYAWLDDVVAWINEQHTWRVDRMIPNCWDQHPHLVHELAVLGIQRWEAATALTPMPLEDWQRLSLPSLLDRLSEQIGSTGCPPGRHQPRPGLTRSGHYTAATEREKRRTRRWNDGE